MALFTSARYLKIVLTVKLIVSAVIALFIINRPSDATCSPHILINRSMLCDAQNQPNTFNLLDFSKGWRGCSSVELL